MLKDFLSDYISEPFDVSFTGEDKDETVLLLARRHIITFIPSLVISIAMLFVPSVVPTLLKFGGFPLEQFFPLPTRYLLVVNLFWYLAAFTFLFEAYLVWYSNVYIVTNKRLVDVDFFGILNLRVSEAPLRNIEDVTYTMRGVWATVFNYGSVHIQTAGETETIEFELVPKPALVHDKISDLAADYHENGRKQNGADTTKGKDGS